MDRPARVNQAKLCEILRKTRVHRERSGSWRASCAILPIVRFCSFVLLLGALSLAAQTAPQKYTPQAPAQPIPYSHKQHLALGLDCKTCHEQPDPGADMGIPAVAKCMSCHKAIKTDSPNIQKLAQYQKDGQEVPWVRVYRIPDYVDFSHKTHLAVAKVTCENCHGPVKEREAIRKESDISMAGCMDCHRSHDAPVACDTCHDPR